MKRSHLFASAVSLMIASGADKTFINAAFGPSRGYHGGMYFGGMSVPRPKNQRQNRRDAARVRGHRK